MTIISVLGAGQAGVAFARAAIGVGYRVILANSRGPHTLQGVVGELGPQARAATSVDAAAEGDVAFLAFPYMPSHELPGSALAGKIVMDNNNYMPWRDGRYPDVDSGAVTVHELRQRQLPEAQLAKAFSHIQFHGRVPVREASDALPALVRLARPAGDPKRIALSVSSDHPAAVAFVTRLYDELGFDTVDSSPLAESWRSAPGTPTWAASVEGQGYHALQQRLREAPHPARRIS